MGKKKSAAKQSGGTPALVALERAGVSHTVHDYHHDDAETSFGEEAARELGVEPTRVFKTLVVDPTGDGKHLAVVVVPVTGQVDLKAAAHALGVKKLAMADRHVAAQRTGYVPGGISPLGQRQLLPTVVDSSALATDTIFVSAGKRGLDVELAASDLVRLLEATTADIATD
ncbi:MAG: Cys-tRNA(Pro) deacylase [Galactobacter sp.]